MLNDIVRGMLIGVAVMATVLSGVCAQTLKQMRAKKIESTALAREASYTELVCDISLDISIDWISAKSWPPSGEPFKSM